MFKVMQRNSAHLKTRVILPVNISKGAFYLVLGVPPPPLTQTQALQLSRPIWTQTQTNVRPTASDLRWGNKV